MKLFGLLNLLLAYFGGAAIVIAVQLYRTPLQYVLLAYPVEYELTYGLFWIHGILTLLLAGVGCYAAHERNLKIRRTMLIAYAVVMSALFIGEQTFCLWFILRAYWSLRDLPNYNTDDRLFEFLVKTSGMTVDWRFIGWLSSLSMIQGLNITMAAVEMKRARREMRLRRLVRGAYKDERELAYL